jgi:hypothetical protein
LRAFTPTEPEAVDQFSAINELLPPNTGIERITAFLGEESEGGRKKANNVDYDYNSYDDGKMGPF